MKPLCPDGRGPLNYLGVSTGRIKERLYITAEPDDFILAVRAVKSAMNSDKTDVLIAFEDGKVFWVRKAKKGWSVRQGD